jgi:protein phosphatase 2C family protein 2/3
MTTVTGTTTKCHVAQNASPCHNRSPPLTIDTRNIKTISKETQSSVMHWYSPSSKGNKIQNRGKSKQLSPMIPFSSKKSPMNSNLSPVLSSNRLLAVRSTPQRLVPSKQYPVLCNSFTNTKQLSSSSHIPVFNFNAFESMPNKDGVETEEEHVDYKLYEDLFKNKRKISISYGVFDSQGFRESMEDEYFFVKDLDTFSSKPSNLKPHCAFGIFDGHCGKDAATFCKQNICKYLVKSNYFLSNIEKALEEGFLACDEALRRFTQEEDKGSPFAGCTANVAIVRENMITVANCGDSRAVLANEGKAIPMSEDHKPNRLDEKKRIEALGGSVEYGRIGGLLAVSRAFGDFEYKIGGKHLVTAVPDVKSFTLQRNTDFIILACDGLWDVMSSSEAVKLSYQWLLETQNLDRVCEKLVETALNRNSMDNITCMIVAFHDLSINNNLV